jgi:hypothetical protein
MESNMLTLLARVGAMQATLEFQDLNEMISEEKMAVQRARDLVDCLDVIYLLESRILQNGAENAGKHSGSDM